MSDLVKFLEEVDRLIIKEQVKSVRIKSTRIKRLQFHRPKLVKLSKPFQQLALQYLDEITEFANVLNEEGDGVAMSYGDKAAKTLDALAEEVDKIGDGPHSQTTTN